MLIKQKLFVSFFAVSILPIVLVCSAIFFYNKAALLGNYSFKVNIISDSKKDSGLAAKTDVEQAFKPIAAIRNFILFICVILFLSVALIASATVNSIIKPIEELRKATMLIGEGNFDHKVATDRSDEVGQLSRAFDKMVAHLKETMASRDELEKEIVKRKKSEETNLRLSQAVEQSSAVIVITDTQGTIEYVNPSFERVTGYSAKEAIGKNPRILKSGYQPLSFYKHLWDTIKSGKVWRGEFNNRTKSGAVIWEAASIAPIKDAQGNISAFVAVKEDTTERRHREDHLRNLRQDLERSNNELETTAKELMLFNNAAIGREERMIELKKEINRLSELLALKPPYDLSFLETHKDVPS